MGRYFGIDGIRGEVNRELIVDKVLRFGYVFGYYLKNNNLNEEKIKVIMGSDIRIFGYMFRFVLIVGFILMGIYIDFVGVIFIFGVVYIIK